MTGRIEISNVEWMSRIAEPEIRPSMGRDGIYYGDPFTYQGGALVSDLRSGQDGPYTELADQLCGLRRDTL